MAMTMRESEPIFLSSFSFEYKDKHPHKNRMTRVGSLIFNALKYDGKSKQGINYDLH